MEENVMICSHCGGIIECGYEMINGQRVCSDCVSRYTVVCDRCGATIWDTDAYGDEYTTLCHHCYDNYYVRCERCDCLIYCDDNYRYDGSDYCSECYHDIASERSSIKEYRYKPDPVFYGNGSRYFGVELEIDIGGRDTIFADELLEIGNEDNEHIYIKSDGSLNDGMKIVSHPMTLDYHTHEMNWEEVMKRAISLGYRSHQTSTCGLHVHVNRTSFGDTHEEQEDVISRILYFVEHHWNELLKFSRRSEATMNRWAARYGYENTPKAIMDKAKKGCYGRYTAINLCNYHTVEFRLFRGTLKLNTLIATLQLVNEICSVAVFMSDEQLQSLSWSEFVSKLTETELIQYLKERNLYINEKIDSQEEM